jgi:hypothetical protein
VPRSRPSYILTEVEPAKRYQLTRKGQDWMQEFSTVSAAYFYARSHVADAEGQMMVIDQDGIESTLYLF